jgi:DNA polymerase-3 subunit beta
LPAFPCVILPLPVVKLLPSLLKGFTETVTISISPRLMTFAAGTWRLTTKLVDGTFPGWRQLLPSRSEPPIVVEMKALRAAVDRIASVCPAPKTKTSGARLWLSGGELVIAATTDATDAEVETKIPVESGPDEAKVALSARFLAEALDVIDADHVELHTPAGRQPVVWLCAAGDTENGIIIVPMRM